MTEFWCATWVSGLVQGSVDELKELLTSSGNLQEFIEFQKFSRNIRTELMDLQKFEKI